MSYVRPTGVNTRSLIHLQVSDDHVSYHASHSGEIRYSCRTMVPDGLGT